MSVHAAACPRKPLPCSRRQVLRTVSATVAGMAAARAKALLRLTSGTPAASAETHLLEGPIVVPRDFVGLHAHRWPADPLTSPAPSFAYGAARSHDFEGAAWCRIQLAPNRFDWSALDRWVEAHAAMRHTLVYTLYGTPTWLAGQPETPDRYGQPGGASAPRDLARVDAFITALVDRYNGDGHRRLHLLETWNEPRFDQSGEGFWSGSAAQLASVGRTANLAAKRVDPGLRVLSPGFAGDLSGGLSLTFPALAAAKRSAVYQYLTAPDGHGGEGSHWCDGIAFHTYDVPAQGENAGYLLGTRKLQKMLSMMGIDLPLFNTETGFTPEDDFHHLSAQEQGLRLRRIAAVQAALGVKGLFFYAFDDNLIGNPSQHAEIADAVGDVHKSLAGKTLRQVTLRASGQVEVLTSERTLLW